MRFLFGMECKKIAGSILYWVLVLALLAVSLFQFDPAVENELGRTNDPDSVFYIALDGSYADEQESVPDEAMERTMMAGATNRLINNYRSNRYEYYPFGYVKEKTMSAQEQAVILQYLMELTGLSEQDLNGTADGTGDTSVGDVPISGGGAFVLEPGKGSTNENGQFVAEPDDWQYVPGDGASSEAATSKPGDSFEIQVSFERFREIMEEVNRLIGRNSYFSWTMLTLYYFGNDMEDTPITERQHQEFYECDQVTGAFARYYCDGISADALAFVKYTLAWILPTVLLVIAISLLVTVLLENYTAILISGVIWLIGRPSVDKIAGGDYGLLDIIIRHNTLKGYGRMMENIQMLALNRIAISIAAFVLVGLSVFVYSMKRKGVLNFGYRKPIHNHRFKLPSEL